MALFGKNWLKITKSCVSAMRHYRNWPEVIASSAMRRYHNWPEVIASSARKQFPPRYILRDGTRFEAAGGFKERWQIEDIFFKRAYLPKPLTIRPDDVVIDIGANVGVFSIFAAKRTRNMVYAFEPFPDNCNIFTHVLTINHLSNVILQQVAVSDCTGSASLQVSSASGTRHFLGDQQILQTLEDYQKKDEHRPFAEVMPGALSDTLEVSTTTLQEIMDRNHLQTVGILKINCEGAEGAIIQATPIAYLQRIQQIFVHFHVHLSLISPDEMQKRLEEAGFTITREWDGVNPLGHMYGWKPRGTLPSLSRQEAAKV